MFCLTEKFKHVFVPSIIIFREAARPRRNNNMEVEYDAMWSPPKYNKRKRKRLTGTNNGNKWIMSVSLMSKQPKKLASSIWINVWINVWISESESIFICGEDEIILAANTFLDSRNREEITRNLWYWWMGFVSDYNYDDDDSIFEWFITKIFNFSRFRKAWLVVDHIISGICNSKLGKAAISH